MRKRSLEICLGLFQMRTLRSTRITIRIPLCEVCERDPDSSTPYDSTISGEIPADDKSSGTSSDDSNLSDLDDEFLDNDVNPEDGISREDLHEGFFDDENLDDDANLEDLDDGYFDDYVHLDNPKDQFFSEKYLTPYVPAMQLVQRNRHHPPPLPIEVWRNIMEQMLISSSPLQILEEDRQ
ncbi:hypothetical protein G7Y89_g15525 [Cudoniella acicularis]|uniref:Uncharacterized protein n=1 Tax=Cudoniella acicularis TaxID=354080 RepID=A0A8H4QL24_9HELO|nr:hypothetical protein G7Y89_g15525 [Cudoniella acicularis]